MLSSWLAPEGVTWFLEQHFHRAPLARPAVTQGPRHFDWPSLGAVLAHEPAPDVLCVARGRVVDIPAPRSRAELETLFAAGEGLVLRHGERHDARLARMAEAFVCELPGELNVQIFATPGGTHGFGWHYDFEDVFLVQTEGIKDYYFRPNTVDPARPRGERPDFSLVTRESSPLATARLVPGDWLYIPARWWHVALCVETSLSLSFGVFPRLDS